ncbi:hypothetical protein [Bradyrhizobium liaoningense]|uniref:hypothetical protein n=1 Tax=Bradyrhizobium liaoningense TaxID=43992 RepID=UPI001BA6566C|nr:hypothetical protein [Bradyrhizobium liaoningense]MBR0901208.1 hypothetical protein [Bradyrhizobium liaoningense]
MPNDNTAKGRERLITFRVPPELSLVVENAAKRDLTTVTGYARRALLERLRQDERSAA